MGLIFNRWPHLWGLRVSYVKIKGVKILTKEGKGNNPFLYRADSETGRRRKKGRKKEREGKNKKEEERRKK